MTDCNLPEAPCSVSWTPGKAPIITLREGTVLDWATTLKEFQNSEVIEAIAEIQTAVNARFEIVTQLGAQRVNDGAPSWAAGPSQPAAGFTAPPAVPQGGGEAKYCQHGMRNFKSGTNKNGKPYSGYFCSANQCPPEWG